MLTSRGRRTIAVALLAGVIGRIFGIPELFGLATAAVVVVLAAFLRVRIAKGTLTVTARVVPPVVTAGQSAVLELTIEESGVAGSLSTSVILETDPSRAAAVRQPAKIIVPRLRGGDRVQVTFELPTERRGLIGSGAYEAAIGDPLGLARRRLATSRPARCTVLPRIEQLPAVAPKGLGWAGFESRRSAVERPITGSSSLRPYAHGDDLRRIHWRTTARVGELMVREGEEDRDDSDQVATTVLLDVGGDTTSQAQLDRAVEVAASVAARAAAESSAGTSGAYRVLTTTGLDTGAQRGYDGLQSVLIALAGIEPDPMSGRNRFSSAVERLSRPDRDELLFVVGALGDDAPDAAVLDDLARSCSAVVLVLVGAPQGRELLGDNGQVDAERRSSRGVVEIGSVQHELHELGGGSRAELLTVLLPFGMPLAAAWSLDPEAQGLAEGGGQLSRATEVAL